MNRLWGDVQTAAEGGRKGRADLVARLSTVDGRPRLGWVLPPDADRVEAALAPWHGPEPLVLAGTGGWAFGARAVTEVLPNASEVRVLDSLDPVAVMRVATQLGTDVPRCAAVSASGDTHETRALTNTLTALWRERDVVRLSERDGGLSLSGEPDLVALYGTPLSVPALLAVRAATGPAFAGVYEAFATAANALGKWAADVSRRVASSDRPRVVFRLPRGSGNGLRLWTLQAARQGWGGKSLTFRPWTVVVAGSGRQQGMEIDLGHALPDGPPSARAMAAAYAVAALVTCVAVRRGLPFATHDAVAEYKALIPAADVPDGDVPADGPDDVAAAVTAWQRARPDLKAVHVVTYGDDLAVAIARRFPTRPGVEVHAGSAWNHHSYQAVWHEPTIGVAVVLGPDVVPMTGNARLDAALRSQMDLQRAIARATYASLAQRALLLRCAGPVPGEAAQEETA